MEKYILLEDDKKEEYCEKVLHKIESYIEFHIWPSSVIDFPRLNKWLNNFETLDERFFAFKLLNNFIFYNDLDILSLCEYGLNDIISKREISYKQQISDFSLNINQLSQIQNGIISNIAFIPLTSNNNPSESAIASLAKKLVLDLGFLTEDQFFYPSQFEVAHQKGFRHFLFFDDFIGTGEQIENFWNFIKIPFRGRDSTFKEVCKIFSEEEANLSVENKTFFEYLALVATREGINYLESDYCDLNGLSINYCEILEDENRVFSKNSVFFENTIEMETAKRILGNLLRKKSISLFGYGSLDYAIAFTHNIPDASLPLFFKMKPGTWNNLFKNKYTHN